MECESTRGTGQAAARSYGVLTTRKPLPLKVTLGFANPADTLASLLR